MDKLLITTKKLDARLSRLFLEWESITCINLQLAIENFLFHLDDEEEKDRLLMLLKSRLKCSDVVEALAPNPGLTFKLPDDRGLLTVYRPVGYGYHPSVVVLDISETHRLDVRYWL